MGNEFFKRNENVEVKVTVFSDRSRCENTALRITLISGSSDLDVIY